ncbi:MAG: OmpA family protein [Spirochaetia bacterium]|jgi:outer membrane protein OmpA-like peptidoglycan-associated protein|nr:OmpA family protein [Spirochaetia bacterium]
MSKFIEVEIENKSYIQLLNLEKQQTNTLKLTTLKDNQTAVIIKVFLNKSDTRIPIKEFSIRNLQPKVSGIPRFELISSYNYKMLHLQLKVDGRKVEDTEIKLSSYFRNKLLPLFIIIGLIAAILFFAGGKWLFSGFIFNNTPTTIEKPEVVKAENINPIETNINNQTEKVIKTPKPVVIKTTEDSSEVQNIADNPVKEIEESIYITYFTPNNTSIQKDTALILKDLAQKLKNMPDATVEISGYCAMTGTEEGRERLSKERAYNVFYFLKNERWIPGTEPVIKWFGGSRPVTYNENEIYKNSRVEIKIETP